MSLKLYIPIGLMLPTICGVHVSHIYMLILEICCQQFGEYVSVEYIYWYWIYHANTWAMNVSLRVSVCPSGTGLGNVQFWKCLFVLEICCQQFGEYVSVEPWISNHLLFTVFLIFDHICILYMHAIEMGWSVQVHLVVGLS